MNLTMSMFATKADYDKAVATAADDGARAPQPESAAQAKCQPLAEYIAEQERDPVRKAALDKARAELRSEKHSEGPTPRTDALYDPLDMEAEGKLLELCQQLERELAGYSKELQRERRQRTEYEIASQSARAAIIEECARVCETSYTTFEGFPTEHGKRIANAIRALSSGSEREGP